MIGADAVPVVFIGGTARSGSTLVSRVLGTVPGFCAVGELFNLWDHGVQRNDMCGCGAPFHDCSFWNRVGKESFGGWGYIDVTEMLNLRDSVASMRHLPLFAVSRMVPSFRHRLERYSEVMGLLYRGIQAASDCAYVVDSSKWPATAFTTRHVPGIDMRLIHLVRSSQGVCYSCAKTVPRPDISGALMPRQRPAITALRWLVSNFAIDAFRLSRTPSMLLRYEDFVARPDLELRRVLGFLGKSEDEDLSFVRHGAVDLARDHVVAGNPMRIKGGRQTLRLDEEWRSGLSPMGRRGITALTAPGLLRYGYSLTRG